MNGHNAGKHARQALGYPFSSETDSDMEHNERKKITKGVAGHLLDIKDEDTGSSVQHLQLEPKGFIAASASGKGNRPYVLAQSVGSSFWGSQELGPEFPILSKESANISKESLTEADKKEYEELCPTLCPSRDVMVCGKCQHGIYKTFLSVCHLRMFTCNHQDEILQLMSRYPCVLSAPYISETNQLKGRVVEPGDDDKVLRFIMCRDQGKLGTDEKPPVTFLLLIQMEYIIAKAIENPLLCNDSPENDPRLKRSDEKEINFDSEDTTGKDRNDDATRKTFSKPNNENDNDHDANDNENSNEFASNSNALPQKLALVNSVTKSPVNVDERGIITDRLTSFKDAPLEQPVYYKAIDPKYIIISGLSLPKPSKNITNVSKSEDPVNIDLKETMTTPIDYSNLTKAMNDSNGEQANEEANEANEERKEVEKNYADTDVSNIRELREHLFDHLLDYFLNIIKEENYIRNDTRKKNGKDRMKVEEKLRNYYDPQHLDMLFDDDDDDDDDYYDTNLDPSDNHGDNDSEEDLLDNVNQNKAVNKENITNIYALTLTDKVGKNSAKAHTSPEDLQKEVMSLEQNLNKSSPGGKSFNVNTSEPVTSKYVNLIEKENDLTNVLLNITEKSEDAFDTNVNVITTSERSVSNEALNDKAAEVETDLLNYSEEEVTDAIVYDNDALTVGNYTSYEDYIDSDEFEVVKNVTVHENDRNPIVITTANGRRKNELDKEKYIANGTLNDTLQTHTHTTNTTLTNKSQKGNNANTSKDIDSEKKNKPNNLAIQDPSKICSNCDEDILAENKNKKSSNLSKQSIKRNLRIEKNFGKLDKNNKLIYKKFNKHNCRKSIILNLNINLI